MQVLQVKEYNRLEMIKYSKRCDKWTPQQGGFPQQAFFGFYTNQGMFRKTGYVVFDDNQAYWKKTKKEAIQFSLDIDLANLNSHR